LAIIKDKTLNAKKGFQGPPNVITCIIIITANAWIILAFVVFINKPYLLKDLLYQIMVFLEPFCTLKTVVNPFSESRFREKKKIA